MKKGNFKKTENSVLGGCEQKYFSKNGIFWGK